MMFTLLDKLIDTLESNPNKELAEIKQITTATAQALKQFNDKRPTSETFDGCWQSLVETLDECALCVGALIAVKMDSQPLLQKLGKLDFLIKQKTDQIVFIFGSEPDCQLATKLTNEAARRFWVTTFGANACMVPFEEFVRELARVSGLSGELSAEDIEALREYLAFTGNSLGVSVYELEIFRKSFGPLTGCVNRLLLPFKLGILANVAHTTAQSANTLLTGRSAGSYLVRLSKSNPGTFAVTYIDSKLKIKHCLLYPAQPYGLTLKEPPEVYPSLDAFVKAHGSRLVTPVGTLVQ